MALSDIRRDIDGLRRRVSPGGRRALAVIGTGAALVTLLGPFIERPLMGAIAAIVVLVLAATLLAMEFVPERSVVAVLPDTDGRLDVRVVDLMELDNDVNLLIGMNDFFDATPGSLLHQVRERHFDSTEAFGKEMERSLEAVTAESEAVPDKLTGGSVRYPIGTFVRLESQGPIVYLFAFARMDTRGSTTARADDLWPALLEAWACLRWHNPSHVAVPVVGSGLGRAQAPRRSLLALLVLSLLMAQRDGRVCERVTVAIRAEDYQRGDLEEARALLRTLGCQILDRGESSSGPSGHSA